MWTVHPRFATLPSIVFDRRLPNDMRGDGAKRVVTKMRNFGEARSRSDSLGAAQHFSQRAKLVGPLVAQLNISFLLGRHHLCDVAEAGLDGVGEIEFEELQREGGIIFEELTLSGTSQHVFDMLLWVFRNPYHLSAVFCHNGRSCP